MQYITMQFNAVQCNAVMQYSAVGETHSLDSPQSTPTGHSLTMALPSLLPYSLLPLSSLLLLSSLLPASLCYQLVPLPHQSSRLGDCHPGTPGTTTGEATMFQVHKWIMFSCF